jgi:hypothetical protein
MLKEAPELGRRCVIDKEEKKLLHYLSVLTALNCQRI